MITRIPLRTLLTRTTGYCTHRNFTSVTQTIPQAHYNVVFDIDGVLIKVSGHCHSQNTRSTCTHTSTKQKGMNTSEMELTRSNGLFTLLYSLLGQASTSTDPSCSWTTSIVCSSSGEWSFYFCAQGTKPSSFSPHQAGRGIFSWMN